MDGIRLTQEVLDCIDTDTVSNLYANQRRIYECLDQAAAMYCRETKVLHGSVDITTVLGQQVYDLPPDFIALYLKDRRAQYFIKYSHGGDFSWPVIDSYESIFLANLTDNQDWPNRFAIIDKPASSALINGAATAPGALVGGQCVLSDSAKLFLTTNKVYPRDIIHNITDASSGYVLSVSAETQLVAALFGASGSGCDWTLADAYVIQPAAVKSLVLDAPSANNGDTITVPYVCMPNPVYSDYGFWRFPSRVCKAIAYGAASIFKTGKKEYSDAGQIGGFFASEIKLTRSEIARQALYESRRRQ